MKRTFLVTLLLFCLLTPSTLLAGAVQQPRPTSPARPAPSSATPAAAVPARLPEAKLISHVLPNGLEVIILEDH